MYRRTKGSHKCHSSPRDIFPRLRPSVHNQKEPIVLLLLVHCVKCMTMVRRYWRYIADMHARKTFTLNICCFRYFIRFQQGSFQPCFINFNIIFTFQVSNSPVEMDLLFHRTTLKASGWDVTQLEGRYPTTREGETTMISSCFELYYYNYISFSFIKL